MQSLRRLARLRACFWLALILVAIATKALLPTGYMLAEAPGHRLTLTICADASGMDRVIEVVIPSRETPASHGDDAAGADHCTFAGHSQAALGPVDPVLLALALAFAMLLAFWVASRMPPLQISHLRPPLRGPPALA